MRRENKGPQFGPSETGTSNMVHRGDLLVSAYQNIIGCCSSWRSNLQCLALVLDDVKGCLTYTLLSLALSLSVNRVFLVRRKGQNQTVALVETNLFLVYFTLDFRIRIQFSTCVVKFALVYGI